MTDHGTIGARLQAAAHALRARLDVPGLTAAFVGSDGSVFEAASGHADIEAGTAMTPAHRMLGGSTGKTIVAATAVSLIAEGALDLAASVSRFLGDRPWFARVPNAGALTLRHLLTHTGGLPEHVGHPDYMTRIWARVARDGRAGYLTPEDCVEMILDAAPLSPVATHFYYSDTSYVLAGLAIEAATGRDLFTLAVERVLKPLGLSTTEAAFGVTFRNYATPYVGGAAHVRKRYVNDAGELPFSPRTEWAGGGFLTTARDLAVLARAHAGGTNRHIATDVVRYASAEGVVSGYGIGLFATQSPLGLKYGHGGYFPGSTSQWAYLPEHNVSAAYQFNQSEPFETYSGAVDTRRKPARVVHDAAAGFSSVADAAVELAAAVLQPPPTPS